MQFRAVHSHLLAIGADHRSREARAATHGSRPTRVAPSPPAGFPRERTTQRCRPRPIEGASGGGRPELEAPDDRTDAPDPDRAVVARIRREAADAEAVQQRPPAILLGITRASPVEPLIEIHVVRLLGHADPREPGRGEEVDDPASGEAPRVRPVAGPLQWSFIAVRVSVDDGAVRPWAPRA